MLIDYWKLWSRYTGIPLKFVPAPWDETLRMTKDGEVDLHTGLFYSKLRDEFLLYGPPIQSESTFFFAHRSTSITGADSIMPYRVGVIAGDLVESWLQEKYRDLSIVPYSDYESMMVDLKAGRLLVFAADMLTGLYHLQTSGLTSEFICETNSPLYKSNFYVAVPEGAQETLQTIEDGMALISEEEKHQISRRWITSAGGRDPDTLVIAMDRNYPPFTLLGPGGAPRGMLVEFWKQWSRQTKTPIDFMPLSWEESVNALLRGDADIHSGLFRNPERELLMDFSRPLHQVDTALFFRAEDEEPLPLEKLRGKRVAVLAGSYQQGWLEERYPDMELVPLPDGKGMVLALLQGGADALVHEVPSVEAELSRMGLSGLLSRHPEILFTNTMHAAVKLGHFDLLDKIDAGFAEVPVGSLAAIEARWIAAPEDRYYATAGESLDLTRKEQAWIREHPALRIASSSDWPPFEFVDDQGDYKGISKDVLELAAKRVGLRIEPAFSSWDEQIINLKQKKLDLAPAITLSAEREKFLLFTEPYLTSYAAVFVQETNQDIADMADLAGKRVAIEKGYAGVELLQQQYPEAELLLVDTTLDALKAVSSGKVDAYYGAHPVAMYLLDKHLITNLKPVVFNEQSPLELRMAVRDDWPILRDIMQKGLDSITPKELRNIQENYISLEEDLDEPEITLTAREKAWLREHGPIRLGIDKDFFPFEFENQQGGYSGVASEYIDFLSRKLGVTMDHTSGQQWSQVLKQAENGEIDLLPCVATTPEREEFLIFTRPYLSLPVVVFSRKDTPFIAGIEDVADSTVAVVQGYAIKNKLKQQHPDMKLEEFPTTDAALEALSTGQVDVFVNELTTTGYAIERLTLSNLKVAAATDYSLDLAMGVRKDWPELAVILDKGLDVVTPGMASEYKARWMTLTFEHKTDLKAILTWAVPVVLGLAVVIAVIVLWNRKLGREVAERKAAESKVRAMSEASLDAVIMINSSGEVLFWNAAAERMFGYAASDAMGKEMHKLFVPEEYRAQAFAGLAHFAKTGTGDALGKVLELYALDAEGERFPVEVAVSAFHLDDGWYAVGSVRDITQRKKAEEALRDAEERSRLVLESAAEGIFGVDHKGGLLFINTAACEMLGICDTDTIGKNVHELIHHSHEDGSHYPVEECPMYWSFTKGGTYNVVDEVLWRSDGTCFPVEYSSAPIVKDEKVVGAVITFRDITQRKLIEEQIKAARAELLLIFDNSQVGIMFMHKDCELARVNQSMADLIGWESPREMVGCNMRDLHLGEESFQEFKQANHAVLLRGEQSRIEYQLKKRDGAPVWCSLSGKAVDTATPPDLQKGVIWVVEDITQRKKMEEELRKSERHFRMILATATEGFWHVDNNKVTQDVNDAMCTIMGRSRQDVLGRTMDDFLDEANRAIVQEQIKRRNKGETGAYELAISRPDGSHVPTILHATPIYDDQGMKTGSFAMVTDISELKAAEEELRVKEKRLRSYFANSLIGVTITSPDTGWIEVNDRFQEMLGYSIEELKPLTWVDLSHPEDLGQDISQYERMLAGEIDSYTLDKRFLRKDGSTIHTNLAVSCVRNDAGDVKMVMGSYIDISERIKAQRERDDAFEVITGSINYATNIQGAILNSQIDMSAVTAEHFVLWEPRDKVGGDIYFVKKWGLGKLIALGDCTGHGVPGAFMTLIVNGALEMALLEVPPGEVGVLLQRVHQLLQKSLDQDTQEGTSDDGIEMGVCYLAPRNRKMTFGGARFSLFRVQDGQAQEIKGDKKGMGYRAIPHDMTYSKQEVALDDNTEGGKTFYMTTDGLIDQVGGPKRRSFGKKRFRQLLLELEDVPMSERGERILTALQAYQGDEKRRDDVAVLGFRLG